MMDVGLERDNFGKDMSVGFFSLSPENCLPHKTIIQPAGLDLCCQSLNLSSPAPPLEDKKHYLSLTFSELG